MKKASVIALCVLLAAALIFAFAAYRNCGEKEKELALCEEEKNALNRKLGESAEEMAAAEAELIEKANARICYPPQDQLSFFGVRKACWKT